MKRNLSKFIRSINIRKLILPNAKMKDDYSNNKSYPQNKSPFRIASWIISYVNKTFIIKVPLMEIKSQKKIVEKEDGLI